VQATRARGSALPTVGVRVVGGRPQTLLEGPEKFPYRAFMATTVEQLAEQALKLPSESRARLADLLVESLDADELGRIDRLWATEAKRRRDEVRSGRVKTIPGEQARRKVRDAVRR
jgi:putative addiction module component (TIGR02574 family)